MPGVEQFGRTLHLTLDTVVVVTNTLRVTFEVERDSTRYPNRAAVTVYNLNKIHRDLLEVSLPRPTRANAQIKAGYGTVPQKIFSGQIRTVTNVHNGTDWETRCTTGDSDFELNQATINQSFAKGTPLTTVFTALAVAMKVGVGNLGAVSALAKTQRGSVLSRGITLTGLAADNLQGLCEACDIEWSVQNGALQLLNSAVREAIGAPALLSVSTGLLNVRQEMIHEKDDTTGIVTSRPQVIGRALLLPNLVPGRRMLIQSDAVTGSFVCTQSIHRGDSHGTGADWVVDFAGVPL